jgi:hypothetical protein
VIDDLSKGLQAKHVAFMRGIARITTTGFDRLFGKPILSLRAVLLSALGSLLMFGLFGWIFGLFKNPSPLIQRCIDVTVVYVGLFIWIVILKAIWISRRLGTWMLVIAPFLFVLVTYAAYRLLFNTTEDLIIGDIDIEGGTAGASGAFWGFAASLPACLAFNWLLLACVRRLVRQAIWLDSFPKILGVMLFGIGVTFAGVVIPADLYFSFVPGISPVDSLTLFLVALTISNLAAGLAGTASVVVAVIMLIHRLLWPIVSRPLYAVTKYGLIKRPKLLASFGLLLLSFSLPRVGAALSDIWSRLH